MCGAQYSFLRANTKKKSTLLSWRQVNKAPMASACALKDDVDLLNWRRILGVRSRDVPQSSSPVPKDEWEAQNFISFERFRSDVAPQTLSRRLLTNPGPPLVLLIMHALHVRSALVLPIGFVSWAFALSLGLYLCDLWGGVAHMVLDHIEVPMRHASERSALQMAAWGFQYHHAVPRNWNDQDMWYYGVCRSGVALYMPWALAHLLLLQRLAPVVSAVWFVAEHFAVWTQVTHAASHGKWPKSRVWRLLHRSGLCISPAQHMQHHTHFDRDWCIFNGWANPLLNAVYSHFIEHRFVVPSMRGHVQRAVYLGARSANGTAARPFHGIFPEWRRRHGCPE